MNEQFFLELSEREFAELETEELDASDSDLFNPDDFLDALGGQEDGYAILEI